MRLIPAAAVALTAVALAAAAFRAAPFHWHGPVPAGALFSFAVSAFRTRIG